MGLDKQKIMWDYLQGIDSLGFTTDEVFSAAFDLGVLSARRDDRVVDGTRLENEQVKSLMGSNPIPAVMTIQDANTLHQRLFDDALEIVQAKRIDYSGKVDPFANFRLSQFWGISSWRGAAIRMMDKISRLKNLFENKGVGEVKDESVRDTVLDCLNYIVIMYSLWLEENDSTT